MITAKANGSQTATMGNTLSMPKPQMPSYPSFSKFGDRRYPGANMSAFLKMAPELRTGLPR